MHSATPPSTSAPGSLRLCGFCQKPFLKGEFIFSSTVLQSHRNIDSLILETSYNRHVLYCRRAKSTRRSRVRSCRACSDAKAKCTFQSQCSRCTIKGIKCVYDNPSDRSKDQDLAQVTTSGFPLTPLTGDVSTRGEFFSPSNRQHDTDDVQIEFSWDVFDDITTQNLKTEFP